MSNELITTPTEIILPPWSNDLSKQVSADIRTMQKYLHPAVHPVNWMAAVINELNKIEEPQKLDVNSVWECIEKLAQTSLYAGSTLGHAYLVPFKAQLQLIVGYKGFIELGLSSGYLAIVSCDWVLTGETATLTRGTDGEEVADFKHSVPLGGRKEATPANVEVAYCVYKTAEGSKNVVVSEKKDLLELQRKASPKSPWKNRYGAMCLKTPIRMASKVWRQTNQLAAAVEADEETERSWEQQKPAFEAPKQIENAPVVLPRGERPKSEVTGANLATLYKTWLSRFERADDDESKAAFRAWQSPITGIPTESAGDLGNWSILLVSECFGRLEP